MALRGGLKGLRGSLEASLESDDLYSTVLLACQGGHRQSTEAEGSQAPAAPEEPILISEGTLQAVVQSLRGIAERRDAEIKRAAQANAPRISSSVRELSAVQDASGDARRRLQELASSLQRLGTDFSGAVGSLEESLSVRDRLGEARAAVAVAIDILERCSAVSASLAVDEVYHARRTLTALQIKYGAALQDAQATSTSGRIDTNSNISRSTVDVGGGVPGTVHSHAVLLAPLAPLILSHLGSLEDEIDQKLTASLHQWLTKARAQATEVGHNAFQLVTEKSKRQEERSVEREEAVKKLQKSKTTPFTSSFTSSSASSSFLGGLLSSLGNHKSTLNNGAAAGVYNNNTEEEEEGTDPVSPLDMSLLLRCVHCHASDGRLPRLSTAYTEAREAQLGADLAPPGDLLRHHAAFLTRLVGYFVIEVRVAAIAPALGSAGYAETSWEGASAAIAAEIGAGIDEAGDAQGILELKNSALMACDAIDVCCGGALSTRGIRAVLQTRAERHRAALTSSLTSSLILSGGDDKSLDKVKVGEVVEALAASCKAYLRGLESVHEITATAMSESYHVVAAAVASSAASELETYNSEEGEKDMSDDASNSYEAQEGEDVHDKEPAALRQCFHLLAWGAAAAHALASLAVQNSVPIGAIEKGAAQLDGALSHLQEASGRRLAASAKPALQRCSELDWAPERMPRTGRSMSPQFADILTTFRAASEKLSASSVPAPHCVRVISAAVHWIGEQLLRVMHSDAAVPTITVYGMQGLLSDLSALAKFADEKAGGRKLCLAEPLALCEAVAFNTAEQLLDPAARRVTFAGMDFERAAAVLEKLRDVGEQQQQGPTAQMLTRKKAMEIAKQLRAALAAEELAA